MEWQLQRRAFAASVTAPTVLAVTFVPLALLNDLPWQLVVGALLLGPAQLLRAAAVLQRSEGIRPRSVFGFLVMALAVGSSTLGVNLLVTGLTTEFSSGIELFGTVVSVGALWHLMEMSVLEWSPMPREAGHRRLKAFMFGFLFKAAWSTAACTLVGALWKGDLRDFTLGRFAAGIIVFLLGDLQACSLQNIPRLSLSDLPRGADLAEALAEPLSTSKRGTLGRWAAMSVLAQAVSFKQFHRAEPASFGARTRDLPPLAADILGFGVQAGALGADFSRAAACFAGRPVRNGGLFALYLQSALEVMREFSVLMHSVIASSRLRGPKALSDAQQSSLHADVLKLVPLVHLSVVGITGWVCASRDIDDAGVVQREDALRKVMFELCGILSAFEQFQRSECYLPVQSVLEEVSRSLDQLLISFESAGLREVSLPPTYKRLLESRL